MAQLSGPTIVVAALVTLGCGHEGDAAIEPGAQSSGGSASGASSGAPASGGGSASSGGSAPGVSGGHFAADPVVPQTPTSCPTIADGTITVLGQEVRLWTGPGGKAGPLVFYWHGTGSVAEEAQALLAGPLGEIQASGGVVASFVATTGRGTTTGNRVWYTGDFEMADVIFACAVEQGLVDARRVFTAGCSAGGLQAGAMVYGRSSYLAGAMPNSGGIIGRPELEDAHVPAVITTHGGPEDFVIISFAQSSAQLNADIVDSGGFVANCDHGGGHCESPPEVVAAQWQFLEAHPFGVTPEPYLDGLPASFPTECEIVQ